MDELLATGVLKSTHGIRGDIKVHSYSDEYDHILPLKTMTLRSKDGRELVKHVEGFKDSGKDLLVKFKGIDTPEVAKTLSGWEIWIPRSAAATLRDGEVYVADLCRCSLTIDQKVVAKVVSVIDGPQALLLEAQVADGKKYLVPFMAQYVGPVDLESQTMELLVPWLLT